MKSFFWLRLEQIEGFFELLGAIASQLLLFEVGRDTFDFSVSVGIVSVEIEQ